MKFHYTKRIALSLLLFSALYGQVLPEYHTLDTTFTKEAAIDYLLYVPPDYHPSQGEPLLLFLTGDEFSGNLEELRQIGPPAMAEAGMSFDYFIAAPALPQSGLWDTEALEALLESIGKSYHIEATHLWVTGYGDEGGWGTWELGLNNPGKFEKLSFVAASPGTQVWGIHESSIRIYHGRQDTLVPVQDAEIMYYELNWDNTDVELMIYENLGHDLADTVYQNLEFYEWLSGDMPQMGSSPRAPRTRQYTGSISRDFSINYLLYLPEDYSDQGRDWPLMFFLHGAGSAVWNIDNIRTAGPPLLFEEGEYDNYILVCPQIHDDVHWDTDRLLALMQHIQQNYKVDETRVYVTGLSRGGFGSWEFAVRYPNIFAAVVPISARDVAGVERLAQTPVWIFHGAVDDGVPWQGAQFMYNRLENAGGNVQLTMYPNVGHWAWEPAYDDEALWRWIFLQQNQNVAIQERSAVPEKISLHPVYPNPFNGSTTVRFSLEKETEITLSVYDLSGRLIENIVTGKHTAGEHHVQWEKSAVSSGVYFIRLSSANFTQTRKMIYLK
jgi:predicted peptidase